MEHPDIVTLDIEDELIHDLVDNFHECYQVIEHHLSLYGKEENNQPLIDECFRAIHSIKAHYTVCEIDVLTHFAQCIEDVVYGLKEHRVEFCEPICDAVLMSMDRLQQRTNCVIEGESLNNYPSHTVEEALMKIAQSDPDTQKELAFIVTSSIAGEVMKEVPVIEKTIVSSKPAEASHTNIEPSESIHREAEQPALKEADIAYYLDLAMHVDRQNPFWTGRTSQLLSLSALMNERAGSPVDALQLKAAVCMHDVGMAFVPQDILHKEGKLDADELEEMRRHVHYATEMTRRFHGLESAAQMIAQHHEKNNGSGYPNGLKEEEICDGAKILAIVDAFFAMTNLRSDRGIARSIARGVTEVNRCAGDQFCPDWVRIFNGIMQDVITKKKN